MAAALDAYLRLLCVAHAVETAIFRHAKLQTALGPAGRAQFAMQDLQVID